MTTNNENNKAVVAFSGGLDTSFCVVYLLEQGYEVTTVTANTGGFAKEELEGFPALSKNLGAVAHHTLDIEEELFDRFVTYLIKGNVLRGQVYPLCAGLERYIQAEKVVDVAKEIGAASICHGSTGAGNDQVRFDVAVQCLDPKLEIITPIRELELSRGEEISFLTERGYEVPSERKKYSINQSILGTTIGGAETHSSWESLPEEAYVWTKAAEQAPDEAVEIELGFEKGIPVALNGKASDGYCIMSELNTLGGEHGVGRGVHLGDTILGIKGRIAFEAPGAAILISAHRELEKLVLTKWQAYLKEQICQFYGMQLHESGWFDPVMRDVESFLDSNQKLVTGAVRGQLYKGSFTVLGTKSEYSLMDANATYGEGSKLWSGQDAAGFSKLLGLQSALAVSRKA